MTQQNDHNCTAPAPEALEPESKESPAGPEEVDWKAEAEKNRDLYLRTVADTENMKKRLEREKAELVKYANEDLIKKILPLLDNLERAITAAQCGAGGTDGLLEGVRLTYEGVINVLTKVGVKPVPAIGERFDPNRHEAVMQKDDPDVENNTVIEEIQKGYFLYDRLIRPAMVIVSRRPLESQESEK